MDIKKQIKNAIETGEVLMGTKKAIDALLNREPKLIIIASNIPNEQKDSLQYYGMLAGIPVVMIKDDITELGSSLGRSHGVAALTVIDAGESTILEVNK